MRLNWVGRASMNSPFRRLAQDYIASLFERIGGRVEGGRVLEVGCGGGYGIELILKRFKAAQVEGIDLDFRMIETARRRLSRYIDSQVRLSVGNVTFLEAKNESFDAVFDVGAIHIEPNWRQALAEVGRVLKPGGRFFFELVTSRALRLPYPLVTERFQGMDPPDAKQFMAELEQHGIVVGQHFVRPYLAALTGWVGDLIGVGWKRN